VLAIGAIPSFICAVLDFFSEDSHKGHKKDNTKEETGDKTENEVIVAKLRHPKLITLLLNVMKDNRVQPELLDHHIYTWKQFFASTAPNFTSQLAGTCLTWFLLDVAFFSQSL